MRSLVLRGCLAIQHWPSSWSWLVSMFWNSVCVGCDFIILWLVKFDLIKSFHTRCEIQRENQNKRKCWFVFLFWDMSETCQLLRDCWWAVEGCLICVSCCSFPGLSGSVFVCTALTGGESTGDVGSLPCPLSCKAFALSLCTSKAERPFETAVVVSAFSALWR